jgi:CheY-like chemotaxis protein
MTKLPLYHRPNALVFLDDETPYLEMLAMVLPHDWSIQFYTRAKDYLAQVQAHAPQWEDDVVMHGSMIDQWYQGKALPGLVLEYWRSQVNRYGLARIAIVDYAMPAANGLDVLRSSPDWPSCRILLTGKADEHVAVAAFNEGLIAGYVTKQNPDLVQHLINTLSRHYRAPMHAHEAVWKNALRRSQQIALQDRAVQSALLSWLSKHDCIEHVVLPEPFGLMALDSDGHLHWLQFEMFKDLSAAVELAKAAGQDATAVDAIANGQALCDAEWQQALGSHQAPQVAPAMELGVGRHLIAAHFPQKALGTIGLGHRLFLERQSARVVDAE